MASLPADTPVILENGVVLPAGVVDALQSLESPSELLADIFSDPAKVLTALSNIGADMTPEDRKKAQTAVVAAIFTGAAVRRMN